jgi:hypothetical protein
LLGVAGELLLRAGAWKFELPIVEDLTRWLHTQVTQEEGALDIRAFREQLRQKYIALENGDAALRQ